MIASNKVKWLMENNETRLSIGVMAANWKQLATSLTPFDPKTQWLHVDIMDGNFVPKITLGDWVCRLLPEQFIIDVHLMVNNPLPLALKCIINGAHVITIQYESSTNISEVLVHIGEQLCTFDSKSHHVVRGVSLCPSTDINTITPLLPNIEMIQLLTLDPRDGSKMSNDSFIKRLKSLTELLDRLKVTRLISVDGSMSLELAERAFKARANIVVSGSAIFVNGSIDHNLNKWCSFL